jgi:hypothetical protein
MESERLSARIPGGPRVGRPDVRKERQFRHRIDLTDVDGRYRFVSAPTTERD